jgi:hypothetical protein
MSFPNNKIPVYLSIYALTFSMDVTCYTEVFLSVSLRDSFRIANIHARDHQCVFPRNLHEIIHR